ncbi:hypothetical protein P692DRAFT_20910259 [Suillus brevipes Sb2]|nr:hypothetical protein P692DRAFT_20910259 [Suillus brevipes Sb2]
MTLRKIACPINSISILLSHHPRCHHFSIMCAVTPSSVTFQTQTPRLAAPPTIITALSSIMLRTRCCTERLAAQNSKGGEHFNGSTAVGLRRRLAYIYAQYVLNPSIHHIWILNSQPSSRCHN